MVRVLQELSALDGGGVAKLLYDYYRHMDHTQIHFDFLIYDFYDNGIYEKPLEDMGCTIFKLPRIKKNIKGYLKGIDEIIRNGNYDVVHSHMGAHGLFVMYYAKKHKVPKRIVHSHIAYEPVTGMKKQLNKTLAEIAKHYATDLFACGIDAGKYMWGSKAFEAGKVRVMTNAVDTAAFQFSSDIRMKKQKELGIAGKYVLGIVGRLSEQKNYPFLFSVYKRVIEKRKDTVLLIIGRGLEEENIKKMADEMGISDAVRFLGVRSDVPELLNAIDLFVLPSRYEGLPVVLIEAQANGVKELVSDRVTKEMDITDLIEFLPIEDTEDKWAETILSYESSIANREQYSELVKTNGYDIMNESKKMQNYYCGNEE